MHVMWWCNFVYSLLFLKIDFAVITHVLNIILYDIIVGKCDIMWYLLFIQCVVVIYLLYLFISTIMCCDYLYMNVSFTM